VDPPHNNNDNLAKGSQGKYISPSRNKYVIISQGEHIHKMIASPYTNNGTSYEIPILEENLESNPLPILKKLYLNMR
jgi:hypothetical protein